MLNQEMENLHFFLEKTQSIEAVTELEIGAHLFFFFLKQHIFFRRISNR